MKEVESIKGAATSGLSNSVAQLVEKIANSVFAGSAGFVGKVKTTAVLGFQEYFDKTSNRINQVKTLISRAEPIPLGEAYVPVNVNLNKREISIDKLAESLTSPRRVILSGQLGAGKSFSMRHMFMQLVQQPNEKIPVFIELRNIDFEKSDIIAAISQQLRTFVGLIDESAVIAGLKAGSFILLLDGLDEVPPAKRSMASKDIIRIGNEYPNTTVVVSSRPDHERFISWSTFAEWHIQPLTEKQVTHLIQKLRYDSGEKRAFLARVKDGLYASHKSLLSNPLLASMMLLTFNEFQDVPSKMYIFYSTAFDVLYRKHDAMKVDFKREFASEIDHHEFRQVFMTMSFLSYVDRSFSFSYAELGEYARTAADYEGVKVDAEGYVVDLIKNLCILLSDGERIAYLHRSFQEYFTGLFLSVRSIDSVAEFVDSIVRSGQGVDHAIEMFIEMDREEFERKYFLQKLKVMKEGLAKQATVEEKLSFFGERVIFGHMKGRVHLSIMQPPINNEFAAILRVLGKYYGLNVDYKQAYVSKSWPAGIAKKYLVEADFKAYDIGGLPKVFLTKLGASKWLRQIEASVDKALIEMQNRHAAKGGLLRQRLTAAQLRKR